MNNLEQYILPYPYKAYNQFERLITNGFDEYRQRIFNWVENNTYNFDTKYEIDLITNLVSKDICLYKNKIIEWIFNHNDKIKGMTDFSGIQFGIVISEKDEDIFIISPHVAVEDNILYPNYNFYEFNKLNIIEKLEWLYDNCEFVPYRILYENITTDYSSYKFSHIKRDSDMMNKLKLYLSKSKYYPNDNIFYFIISKYDSRKGEIYYYLKRDLEKSPRIKQ